MLKARPSVDLQSILDRGAERVGDEDRQAAAALRDKTAFGIDDADRVVLVFGNQHAERGARDVLVYEVWHRGQRMHDDLRAERIDPWRMLQCLVHAATSMRSSPNRPTSNWSPGPITVVAPNSSITAG